MASINGKNSKPVDVGWPLLRYGNRFSWSFCDPDDAKITESLEDFCSSDVFASEITEVADSQTARQQPPTAFLKPCRQLEKQYSATRRSIAGQISVLKGRLDRIAEDRGFRHSTFKEREGKVPRFDEVTGHSRVSSPHPASFRKEQASHRVEDSFELPLYSSANHNAVAVPFKWEDAPGKAKIDRMVRTPEALQLPPRLAQIRQQLNLSSMHCQP